MTRSTTLPLPTVPPLPRVGTYLGKVSRVCMYVPRTRSPPHPRWPPTYIQVPGADSHMIDLITSKRERQARARQGPPQTQPPGPGCDFCRMRPRTGTACITSIQKRAAQHGQRVLILARRSAYRRLSHMQSSHRSRVIRELDTHQPCSSQLAAMRRV